MTIHRRATWSTTLMLGALLGMAGCGDRRTSAAPEAGEPPAPITNRIDVPATVRRNLGITFVDVGYRHVARTRRVPGSFEFTPDAHSAYHASMSGRIEILVEQYQEVAAGDVLFRVDSPAWRELQLSLANTVNDIRAAQVRTEVLGRRRHALEALAATFEDRKTIWVERLDELERLSAAGAGNKSAKIEARAELAALRSEQARLSEAQTALDAQKSTLEAELRGHKQATPLLYAEARGQARAVAGESKGATNDLALARAALLLGMPVDKLVEDVGTAGAPRARWRTVDQVEVRARVAGTVEALSVTTGAWVEAKSPVVETIDRSRVRFRAVGLQADLNELRNGLPARVLPPGGAAANPAQTLSGTLSIGIEADPLSRTIDLIVTPDDEARPTWARSGVSTEVEIRLAGSSETQLAVPLSSVIRDGLDRVIFRRDPKDPDKVIRLVADLGLSDGRWIVLESGVVEGDQVVDHGIYELMLAGSSAKLEGGHFHADGTWHAGSDH